jgi:polysaccharide export outer membrane protein
VSDRWIFSSYLALTALLAGLGCGLTLGAQDTSPDKDEKQSTESKPKEATPAAKKDTPAKGKGAPAGAAVPSAPPVVPPGFRVGVDDELMISVWHEPELSQGVVVRPDGMITIPLLNDIKVVGLTTEELQALLTDKLKSIINEPQVTVVVKAIKSQKVFLMGSATKPGVYPLSGNLTVLQLLAQAGGLGPFAKMRSIYILRHENGKEIRIPFNYKKALSGKGDDPVLQSGDMIVVP